MSTAPPNSPPSQQTPGKSRRTTVLVVLAAIAVVALPLVFSEGRREISRWHQAAAEEKELDGDLDGALASINAAIQWNQAVEVYLMRAQLKFQKKDFEGCLEDCDYAIQQTPVGPASMAIVAHDLRSQAYLELGQFDKAVEDRRTIGDLLEAQSVLMSRSNYLNSLAYYRALGGIELEEAAKDATKAVELLGRDDQLTAAILRGSLSSDWTPAAPVLNEVISYLNQRLTQQASRSKQQIYDEITEAFPPSNRTAARMNRLAQDHLDAAEQLWLLEKRRAPSKTRADGESEPTPSDSMQSAVEELPSLERSREILSQFAPILDTRGFVFYKLALSDDTDKRAERLESAQKDLDRAVVAMEVFVRMLESQSQYQIVDPRAAEAGLQRAKQSLAVIRYHRGLLLLKLGNLPLAARDIARVKQLGHEPDERLH